MNRASHARSALGGAASSSVRFELGGAGSGIDAPSIERRSVAGTGGDRTPQAGVIAECYKISPSPHAADEHPMSLTPASITRIKYSRAVEAHVENEDDALARVDEDQAMPLASAKIIPTVSGDDDAATAAAAAAVAADPLEPSAKARCATSLPQVPVEVCVWSLGSFRLKGVTQLMKVVQLVPRALERRIDYLQKSMLNKVRAAATGACPAPCCSRLTACTSTSTSTSHTHPARRARRGACSASWCASSASSSRCPT